MSLTDLLWNDDQARLRAPWRLVLGTALLGISIVVFSFFLPLLAVLLNSVMASSSIAALCAVLFAVAVSARLLDHRRFVSLGLDLDRGWWFDYAFGLVLGASLMTIVFLGELATGLITVTRTQFTTSALVSLLPVVTAFVAVVIYEELLTRGYQLTNIAEGLRGSVGSRGGLAIAVVLTSGEFGLLHAINPDATVLSTAIITLAGVFLAVGYLFTGDLAIPIGIHTTWNLFQGAVYGFPVSGLNTGVRLIAIEQHGDPMLTGGQFGPEGGLVGVGAILLGIVCVLAYVRLRYGAVVLAEGIARYSGPPSSST